jgi:hypothetical protein
MAACKPSNRSTLKTFVLGTDGNLWLESSPFGVSIPPTTRKQVDGSVRAFQALDTRTVLVLGTDGNLWLESSPFGVKFPPDNRTQVDASVQAFQALETQTVLVLKNRRYPLARVQSVWHEHPSDEPHAGRWQRSSLPRPRQSDDPGAREGSHLWLEFGPFGLNVPPTRELIDVACKPSRRSIV